MRGLNEKTLLSTKKAERKKQQRQFDFVLTPMSPFQGVYLNK